MEVGVEEWGEEEGGAEVDVGKGYNIAEGVFGSFIGWEENDDRYPGIEGGIGRHWYYVYAFLWVVFIGD